MEAKDLITLAQAYESNKEFIPNEETAKMALIVPFLRLLGYDPNSPREVRAEYSAPFTQSDGKRQPDRMDYAVFDKDGVTPLFVIEAKPLGTDLKSRTNQLARYISQLPELHFGVITDGCHYLFYGDLDNPNVMDSQPFFTLALDEPSTDWAKAARFLKKFSRERFDAETLVTDAENSRYRQAISDRLRTALLDPAADKSFIRWMTDGVYTGNRTAGVMERLGRLSKEAIEPALMAVMSDSFVEGLRTRLAHVQAPDADDGDDGERLEAEPREDTGDDGIITTDEEIEFHRFAQAICEKHGYEAANVLYRDTRSYFNVSYRRPTKWFLRLFVSGSKKFVVTRLDDEGVESLAKGFPTKSSAAWGRHVEIDDVAQLWALQDLVVASLATLEKGKSSADQQAPATEG